MYGDENEKITIDKQTFKTLASDTRIGLLKSLNVRRKMLTELSKEHGMSVSTIKEHLDKLVAAGLIVQKDDGHKWKYYELTRKGRAILNPEEKKIWVMLTLALLAAIGAAADMATGIFSSIAARLSMNMNQFQLASPDSALPGAVMNVPEAAPKAGELLAESGAPLAQTASDGTVSATAPIPWLHIILISAFAIISLYLFCRIRKARKRRTKSSS